VARWNNGKLDINGRLIISQVNVPQDGNEVNAEAGLSYERYKSVNFDAVKRAAGRFTYNGRQAYIISDVKELEKDRRDFGLPFVEYPGMKLSDGGDIRDINALGGGMPPGGSFIGKGVPGRKSPYARNLVQDIDHKSPVPRR
jgi:hypothetical protein